MAKQYTISDGRLVLVIKESRAGGYVVTCPFDPELFTEGETIDEAIRNAHEVETLLADHRHEMSEKKAGRRRAPKPEEKASA